MKKNIKILGVGITNYALEQILEYILENIEKKEKKLFITTINSEILVASYKNPDYKKVLNSSDLAIIDGSGPQKAAQILGFGPVYRFAGVDLVEIICERVSKQPITVGFFGGRANVAEEASKCLKEKYPGLKIAFAIEDWIGSEAKSKSLKCDILFVALGHPRQEIWIEKNLRNLDVWAAMGVGGSFDYLSGRVKRAPKFVRNMGFEWLYRLIRQPWRVRRQLSLIYFVLLILKELATGKKEEK